MIRINLLAEGKRAVARRARPGLPAERLADWMLLACTLLGLLIAVGHWWMLRSTIKDKEREIAVAQKEVDELAPIIAEVEAYKAKKAELEHKIQIINTLKANQRGPVQMMDRISRALPELLWLDRMEVRPTVITLTGQAFNTNAVANFIENLDKVPEFQEPILRDTTQRGQVYSFVINFNYSFALPAQAVDSDEATAEPVDEE